MRPTLLAAFAVAFALPLAACGGATTGNLFGSDDGGPILTGDDAGGPDDAGSPIPPVYAPGCPASVPADGSSCSAGFGVMCEYGSDRHCTRVATCASEGSSGTFVWFVSASDPSCVGNAPACPSSFAAVANGSVCPADVTCTYAQGRCACAPCASSGPGVGGATAQWECEAWEKPHGCPEPRPLLGTACSDEGQECDYGPICCDSANVGPAMSCQGGYWTEPAVGCDCAISTCRE